jgi:Secretion system C-terminal sorting domain
MKRNLLGALLLFSGMAGAQIISFPDQNLKNKLLSVEYPHSGYGQADNVLAIDSNQDGDIDVAEASVVYGLNISGASITNLSGLEAFVNLEWIQCGANQITSIDAAMFPNLKRLMCGFNPITSLDVTGFTNLEELDCEYAQLTSLTVAGMQGLTLIRCSGNALTTLDLTGLSGLEMFSSSEGNALTSLNFDDAVNLYQLSLSGTMITELDLSHSPLLMNVGITGNPLLQNINFQNGGSALYPFECQIGDNASLVSICTDPGEEDAVAECFHVIPVPVSISSVCAAMGTPDVAVESIELYPNPTNGQVTITSQQDITSIALFDLQGRLLQTVKGTANIDLSALQSGEYLVKVYSGNAVAVKKVLKN